MLHRNSQKRIYFPDAVYFITCCVEDRFPFFKEETFCGLFIEELKLCKKLKGFKLFGFVIIPDHIQLLIQPNDEYNISKVIKSLKENTSRDINNIILNRQSEGDTSTCRLRIRELIKEYQNQFIQKYGNNQFQFPKFKWQKSFHDHYTRNDNDFENHLEYIWRNPEKHGIVKNFEHYKYSSYNNYKELIDNFD